MKDDNELLDLPEDPEVQFIEYEQRLRNQMWAHLSGQTDFEFDRDQKIYYMTKLMAFHDAHNFSMLQRPNLPRRSDNFSDLFDEFLDEVTYWITPEITVTVY